MGKTLNRFRRLCRSHFPVTLSTSESSTGTYCSVSVIETATNEEHGPSLDAQLIVREICDDDEDEDAYICQIKANDLYSLCKSRAAHDSVLVKADAFLAKKPLSALAAPHLRTQDLITKLDEVADGVDLDIPTTLQKQLQDPVLSFVRSWFQGGIFLDLKAPEIR